MRWRKVAVMRPTYPNDIGTAVPGNIHQKPAEGQVLSFEVTVLLVVVEDSSCSVAREVCCQAEVVELMPL